MANPYLQIIQASVTKQFYVVAGTWKPSNWQPLVIRDTLNGKTYKSFGFSKLQWKFTALFYYSSDPGGSAWALYADVLGWFNSNSATGNALQFKDFNALTTYNVVLTNQFDPKPRSPAFYSPSALWECEIIVRQSS